MILFDQIAGQSAAAPPLLTLPGALVANMALRRLTTMCIPAAVHLLLYKNQLSGSIPEDWQLPSALEVRARVCLLCPSLPTLPYDYTGVSAALWARAASDSCQKCTRRRAHE